MASSDDDGVRSNAEDPNLFDGALSFNLSHGDILESWRRAKEGARVVNQSDLGGNDSRELFEEEEEEEMVRPLPPSRQKVRYFF